MSEHPNLSAQVGVATDPSPETVRAVGVGVAARALREDWDTAELVEVLQMVGVMPTPPVKRYTDSLGRRLR